MQQATWQYLCREFGSPQPAEIILLLSLKQSFYGSTDNFFSTTQAFWFLKYLYRRLDAQS
jgi:hypothetical protein